MENIFKVGDKVYCILHGWGEVIYADYDDDFGIHVSFSESEEESFTADGRFYLGETPVLSFTKYTLEGFSQERPEPLPKKGQVVWVRDFEDDNWEIMHFLKYDVNVSLPYIVSEDMTIQNSDNYKFLTTKNPYKDEKI